MDIPPRKSGHSNDSERSKLLPENSTSNLNSSYTNYYGSTPTNLKIPNVSGISDLNEIEKAFNSYNSNYEDEIKLSVRRLKEDKTNKEKLTTEDTKLFKVDSQISLNSQKNDESASSTSSNRQMNNFISNNSGHFMDTNSLYNFMREQSCKKQKAQIYESLDYEISENVLYLMDKKSSLLSKQKGTKFSKYIKSFFPNQKEFSRWFIIFLIGSFTALTACFIVANVEYFSELKLEYLRDLFDSHISKNKVKKSFDNSQNNDSSFNTLILDRSVFNERFLKLQIPLLFWFITNAVPVFFGSLLVTYLAPVAAASGIPVIKCYLNGVKVPEVVRIKTYIAKIFGVITSVVGGLCSGKEGPLIHCGSVIAAGLSQGKSATFKLDLNIFRHFREDHEKRDNVSAGAAAGVSAAFGAPIGGVLFSLEEGASFWNQILTWRIFFCSLISTFTLNFIMSAINGKIGQMSFSALVNFGKFENVNYNVFEIPIFIFIGCAGGLIGALFNQINHKLTVFRMKYLVFKPIKVFEAVFVALLTAFAGFVLILLSNECKSLERLNKDNKIKVPLQFNCKENEFSTMASLFLSTSENVVINMFHLPADLYSISTLIIFFLVYFFLSVVTYGLSVSGGVFIPALLIGSVFGRIVALLSFDILSNWTGGDIDELASKFSLIGAASVLGGIVRMTLSLTVILCETSGNLTLALPLMICLIFAKWIGDMFNHGLYDIHIKLQQIPFLHCEPHLNNKEVDEDEIIYVSQIMSTPVITMNKIETVRNIVLILQNETHYGFPIVDCSCDCPKSDNSCNNKEHIYNSKNRFNNAQQENEDKFDKVVADYTSLNQLRETNGILIANDNYINRMRVKRAIGHYGKLRGFILRWQLIVLLQKKLFNHYLDTLQVNLNSDIFRDAYPRYDKIEKVAATLTDEEMDYKIDLGYVMNPSPYSIAANCSFDRTFRLFRALGLRHLCVIDDSNNVIGIVTRKDMSHFKVITHKNKRYIQKYSETLL